MLAYVFHESKFFLDIIEAQFGYNANKGKAAYSLIVPNTSLTLENLKLCNLLSLIVFILLKPTVNTSLRTKQET